MIDHILVFPSEKEAKQIIFWNSSYAIPNLQTGKPGWWILIARDKLDSSLTSLPNIASVFRRSDKKKVWDNPVNSVEWHQISPIFC